MYDKVLSRQSEVFGISIFCGYGSNEGQMLSLATVEEAYAEPSTKLTLVWDSRKPSVERYVHVEIQAMVGPAPYSDAARQYRATVARR